MRKLTISIFVATSLSLFISPLTAHAQDKPPGGLPEDEPPAPPKPTPPAPPKPTPPLAPPPASPPRVVGAPASPEARSPESAAAPGSEALIVPPSPAQGGALTGVVFPEDRPPPVDPKNPDAIQFGAHGYFRAPLRISWRRRGDTKPDESKYDLRTPWLVDDDYYRSGFGYTPNNESDYSEIFLMAGNAHLTGTVALMGSLYSDPARPLIDRQMGIAQGYLTYRFEPEVPSGMKLRVRVKGGAFWDRFGWMPHYDTYIFGRTHQMGEQVRAELDVGRFTFSALHGVGAHLEAIDANQGLSLLNYFRLGAAYGKTAEVALYYLRTWTQDKRQLKELTDASMKVIGIDATVTNPLFGRLYLATSVINADQSSFLSPSLEVMHSFGGRGITENFLGTQKSDNGTGSLWNVGLEYSFSLASMLKKLQPGTNPFHGGDLTASLFGLYTFAQSHQSDPDPAINRDDRKYFKYGGDLAYWPLHWLGVSARYDRVVMNVDDQANTFRIFSPRVSLRAHWLGDAQIFFQWSRYFYEDRVKLRAGQVALETQPDDNVVKIQAQLSF